MMKLITLSLLFAAVVSLALNAHAQSNKEFSSFQCDPTSCSEEGPAETSGSVFVSFTSTCTGGVVAGMNGNAKVTIGPGCHSLYIPYALVQTSTTELYNNDTCPATTYYVSYVTPNAEVFNVFGTVVFHTESTTGCDGSTTGLTVIGTKPC
jgi:hypothetical protein